MEIIKYVYKENISNCHNNCNCDRCLGDIFRRWYMEYLRHVPDEKTLSFSAWIRKIKSEC